MGQANFFKRFAPEKIPLAIDRYVNETDRLLTVLDKALEGKEWLAGDQYTIADIANFCWARMADGLGEHKHSCAAQYCVMVHTFGAAYWT